MIMSARERTHEFAILKALGFSAGHLFFLLAGESLLLAVIGSALGLAVTLPAVQGFRAALPKGWFPIFYMKPETVVIGCLASLGVGLVAAIVPLRRVLSTHIVDGLRHVG
jgi:putative ABC transport system permease protein